MERALCLVMGYVFGLFQTGYIYSRSKHMDIRNYRERQFRQYQCPSCHGKESGTDRIFR